MKNRIEDLEKGDIVDVQYGYLLYKSVYIKDGIVKVMGFWLDGKLLDLEDRFWVYRRKSLVNWLKTKLK
jgi:hypothetical protein